MSEIRAANKEENDEYSRGFDQMYNYNYENMQDYPIWGTKSKIIDEQNSTHASFWEHATQYTTSGNVDKSFVNEIAYLMVSLHLDGA